MVNQQPPVAAKRAMHAIRKPAADLCASRPERAARRLVDRGFAPRYDHALQKLRDVSYDRWREYNPEGHDPLLRAAPLRHGKRNSLSNKGKRSCDEHKATGRPDAGY